MAVILRRLGVSMVFETILSTEFRLCWNSLGVFADVKTDGDLYVCLFPASILFPVFMC
jgi:hypothetical protein